MKYFFESYKIKLKNEKSGNLSQEEYNVLLNLKNDQSLKIVKADKSDTLVIMNSAEYYDKGKKFLANDAFTKTNRDDTLYIYNQFQNFLKKLVKNIEIDKELLDSFKPSLQKCGYAYFYLKFTNQILKKILNLVLL